MCLCVFLCVRECLCVRALLFWVLSTFSTYNIQMLLTQIENHIIIWWYKYHTSSIERQHPNMQCRQIDRNASCCALIWASITPSAQLRYELLDVEKLSNVSNYCCAAKNCSTLQIVHSIKLAPPMKQTRSPKKQQWSIECCNKELYYILFNAYCFVRRLKICQVYCCYP